jgi:site-specific DNA recombinase
MRVVAYVRVSKAEQVDGYSLDAQRRAIQKHCEDHAHQLVGYFADEGISARYDAVSKRPGFRAALEAVEQHHADAIAVHKLDRFARNVRVFHESLHRIGNKVIFVTEGIDLRSPVGELMAGILAQFSQFFSRNLATESKKGLDERRRQGLYNGGPLPFGVRKDPDARDPRRALPVPDTVPVLCTLSDHRAWSRYDALLLIFSATVQGTSAVRIANELRAIGFELSPPGVRHIILNRFYIGEIPAGHRPHSPYAHAWAPGAHSPIIEPTLFEAANKIAANMPCLRRVKSVRRAAQRWALTGLLICARCRGPMHVKTHKDGPRIECYNRYDKQRCDQPGFKQEKLEPQIVEILRGYVLSEDVIEAAEAYQAGHETKPDSRHRIQQLKLQRNRLDDLYIDGSIIKERYLERAGRLERELAELTVQDTQLRTPQEIGNLLRDLPSLYEAADQVQRNELLQLIFEALMVDSYTVVRVKPRSEVASLLQAVTVTASGNSTAKHAVVPLCSSPSAEPLLAEPVNAADGPALSHIDETIPTSRTGKCLLSRGGPRTGDRPAATA